MASVNENLNTQRSTSVGRSAGAGSVGRVATPAADSPRPVEDQPKTSGDQALIAARPTTEAERQQAILQAVKAAQAGAAENTEKADEVETDPAEAPTAKKVADGIGLLDGVKEGAKIATSSDELAKLPVLGKAVQRGSRFGKVLTAIAESKAGKAIANALKTNKVLAPAVRFLGRVAPFAGLAVAGYDIYDAVRTAKDPKASTAEKALATTKGVLSGIAGTAGVVALALAPTGVGAAIAGGIALGAGLLSLGADLILGQVRKNREDSGK